MSQFDHCDRTDQPEFKSASGSVADIIGRAASVESVANVKGFGCRPGDGGATGTEGRRPKASKGGNRGNGYVGRCGARYGDLSARRTADDGRRCDAARRQAVDRLVNEGGVGLNAANPCAI